MLIRPWGGGGGVLEGFMVSKRKCVLLLLPTRTYRATDFLAAAGRLDIEVAVGSDRPQTLSELSPRKTLTLNFQDAAKGTEEIVRFASAYPIDAIIGVDDDTTILAAMASKALSFPYNSVESAYATRNKYRMRKALADTGIHTPRFKLFSTDENPDTLAHQIGYPCIVKPLSLSASRGVIRADTPAEFVGAFRRVAAILQTSDTANRRDAEAQQVLVESYIPGIEVAVEGILLGGTLKILAIFDKPDPLDGPFFEETLYITPSKLPDHLQEEIAGVTAHAAKTLGLREGPLHAELRLNDEGVWPLEIAARSIGGLCSRTLRFGIGISLEELILRHAVGMEVESLNRETRAAGVMMIPIPRPGVLREVSGQLEAEWVDGIEGITISIPLGQTVVPLPEGSRYLGFIFARGNTFADVEQSLREAHGRLEFVIGHPS